MKKRTYDRYGMKINELNMQRDDGMSDYERLMEYEDTDAVTYEEALNQCANAWREIVRGYFVEHAADYDLESIAQEYQKATVHQSDGSWGWFFEDCPAEVLNKIAQKHYIRG